MNELYKKIIDFPYLPNFVKKTIVIGINWMFQSILYMDKTERIFKISLDFLFMGIFITLFLKINSTSLWIDIVLAFLIGHTLNWLFNGNLFALLKTFGTIITTQEKFEMCIKRLKKRAEKEPSIIWIGIYGSLVRGEFKETSDLDVRLIRKPGLINGVRACVFVMRERMWANLNRFPLDIYVRDGFNKLQMRERNPWVIYSKCETGGPK